MVPKRAQLSDETVTPKEIQNIKMKKSIQTTLIQKKKSGIVMK